MSSSPLPHQLGYKVRRHVSDGVKERETAFPHTLAKHGSLRAGNDRLGKLVSVIILIMLIAAISTPAVLCQRQARLVGSRSLCIEITAIEVTNTHT